MNSFLKITKGELDKIFVRPAIFIMTGFFVLAIVVSVLMFSPSPRSDLVDLANIEGESVTEVYTNFNNNQNKYVFDENLDFVKDMLAFYSGVDNETVTKALIEEYYNEVVLNYNDYKNLVTSYTQGNMDNIISAKNNLKNSLSVLINSYSRLNENFLVAFVTNDDNTSILHQLNQLNIELATSGDLQQIEHHLRIVESIDENKYFNNLKEKFDNITPVQIEQNVIDNLKTEYVVVAENKLQSIYDEMTNSYNEALTNTEYNTSDNNINAIKTLADNYKLTILQVEDIVTNQLMLEIVGDISTSKLKQYTYQDLQNFNKYEAKENVVKNVYLFENNKYSYEFSNVFQSNVNSNEETNAYDFMYYALEFLSFIIIIFCVIIGANMISGETSGGTMKMLAIRPYKRSKIITGKLTATLLIGIIFLIIGTITTFIIGARLYGLSSNPILMIFNAETVSVISAPALFMIFLATLLVRIIVYTVLAVFISTAFKSNVAAVIISVMIYVFVALFGNLFGDSVVYAYLPFANVDLFRFLGGEFVATNGNVLGLDFSCPIHPDINFYISLIISAVFVALLLALTYIIFKKRDIE